MTPSPADTVECSERGCDGGRIFKRVIVDSDYFVQHRNGGPRAVLSHFETIDYGQCPVCNGTGRVPKDAPK